MSKTTLSLLLPLSLILAACTQPPQESESKDTAAAPAAPASPTPAAQASLPVPSTETAASTPATTTTPADTPAARDAVLDALRKFAALKRYHATMTMVERPGAKPVTSEMDHVAPDRFRMVVPGAGTQVVIGDTMYLQAQGRTMQVPLPAGTLAKWRDPASLAAAADGLTAEEAGRAMVAGQPSRKYIVRQTKPVKAETALWIGPKGLPIKIETAGGADGKSGQASIRYSRYDDPAITIEPPK
ncbi:MAG: hypothetical protein J0L89_08660 [Xanthomonadales bacterium]|nr:hypothetical protein [Xanthomonadales bacterium]MBN8264641.1 hypothetical protein [Xanthomonadales bacterium]